MKINKKSWLLALVIGMTACSTEMPVDNKQNVSLSLELSVSSTETKAVGELIDPYFEEVQVLRYHVALFNQDGMRIAHGEYGVSGKDVQVVEGTEGIHKKYSANFTDVPEGKVSVYVIANFPSSWTFNDSEWGNYSSYKTKFVLTELFKNTELVKVGYKEFEVTKDTKRLELPLVQLTAGIDVFLKQAGDVKPEEDPSSSEYVFLDASGEKVYDITNEEDIEEYIGYDIIKNTISQYLTFRNSEFAWASALTNSDGTWNDAGKTWFSRNNDGLWNILKPEKGALYFRANLKEQSSGDGWNTFVTDMKIVAYGRDVDCDVKVPVSGLLTGQITMAGLNKKSDIAILGTTNPENTKYESFTVNSFESRFYTYEPNREDNLVLDVVVGTGVSKNVYRKKYRQYGYKIYRGNWVNFNHDAYSWMGSADKGFPRNAWLTLSKGGKVINEGSGKPTGTEEGDGNLTDSKTYTMQIPCKTITKGHLYQVKGEFMPTVNPTVKWEVVDMNGVTIDIPSFD